MNDTITQLGEKTPLPKSPSEAVLEFFNNPATYQDYLVRFSCPEFTSLCPKTGQPDFANIYIDYAPGHKMVESKSLKLFLASFRNHGAFHEDCSNFIFSRLWQEMHPKWLRVTALWYPRGGIPIDVYVQKGDLPDNVVVLPEPLLDYRGR